MIHYHFDSKCGVWIRNEEKFHDYSDGDEAESYLLEVLRQASDVSATSEELAVAIKDWPSEYHLSLARHNLLRPFLFSSSDRILELGCGCGAITRYLGERGAKVVAVEGSRTRAHIARERCRDLENVTVICDRITDYESEEKFDVVTLIGVLEYATKYVDAPDPVHTCLEHAKSLLKETGVLIVAIENQLGLKYFNGCAEDHAGIPYFGINNLYENGVATTYGRRVISEKIRRAGFSSHEFYYPFPDYKLPGLILSEAALSDSGLNVADLLIHNIGRDYPERHQRAFGEDLAWQVVIENGLLPDMANSFLILARLVDEGPEALDWLAKMYNRGRRRPCFQVESTIEGGHGGSLKVRKRRLYADKPTVETWLIQDARDSAYLSGKLLIGKIRKLVARDVCLEELAKSFSPWIDFLQANCAESDVGAFMLPGELLDCIPANLIEDQAGCLHYFDAEWKSSEPLPMAWILMRGIRDTLFGCIANKFIANMTFQQLVSEIARYSGLKLNDVDFQLADSYESQLMDVCFQATGKQGSGFLGDVGSMLYQRAGAVSEVRRELTVCEAEIFRIKHTVSWRISAPLRATWNFMRHVVKRCCSPHGGARSVGKM